MRHTKRRWNVNVQKATLMIDGKARRMSVCAKCLKTTSKAA